jgi:PAS domain S-box-containing protein
MQIAFPLTLDATAGQLSLLEACVLGFFLAVSCQLARDFPRRFLRLWTAAWLCALLAAVSRAALSNYSEVYSRVGIEEFSSLAAVFFLASAMAFAADTHRLFWLWSLAILVAGCLPVITLLTPEARLFYQAEGLTGAMLLLVAGWMFWNARGAAQTRGIGLLAASIMLFGVNGLDRSDWPAQSLYAVRLSFNSCLEVAMGVAMLLVVFDSRRLGSVAFDRRARGLELIISTAAAACRVERAIQEMLPPMLESFGATHGAVYALEPAADRAAFVLRGSHGFTGKFLAAHYRLTCDEPWVRQLLERTTPYVTNAGDSEREIRSWQEAEHLTSMAFLVLRGRDGASGLMVLGSPRQDAFDAEDLHTLSRIAVLLGTTVTNAQLFEAAVLSQRQWHDTFDSIPDLIVVHSLDYRILHVNRAMADRLKSTPALLEGQLLVETLKQGKPAWKQCPYCERVLAKCNGKDPTFEGEFVTSTADYQNIEGTRLGTVHVLKEFAANPEGDSKYRQLFETMQEGVFVSTPEGRFLDFNHACQKMLGYDSRDEMLKIDIAESVFVQRSDRERLKRLLREYGEVRDFEFQLRRRDGEIRTVRESSFAVHDDRGAIVAYQGFILDVTEQKQAEFELRRRNRELKMLNTVSEMLGRSLDLNEVLTPALASVVELLGVDVGAVYLIDENTGIATRAAAVGHQSGFAAEFSPTELPANLLQQVRQAHATVLFATGLSLPESFQQVQQKEGVQIAPLVVLWSKDRIVGALVVGSRTVRDFSSAELNLLAAAGSQFAATIGKSLLHKETRQAYDDLRQAQEQLLQSEKMGAVGQLISGVAHELNNPLTAILGYGQLLRAEEALSVRASEYLEKLSKQAQRTHHIVQSLLSFARQQKPERRAVRLNEIIDDTLMLQDYRLKRGNIAVHRERDANLPSVCGDFHQLQQVILNILNNAVDAVEETGSVREIWISTAVSDERVSVEITDSGHGIQDPRRVFDPFYTTKPVGKGTGLGLSICYGIIKEHGGEISVRNAPPRGAAFTVSLPIEQTALATHGNGVNTGRVKSESMILLVDSEESALELEKDVLESRQVKVQGVRDGRTALRILEDQSVEAVVIDVQMAGEVTGWGLYRWIERNRPQLARRVVFTFATGGEEEVRVLVGNTGCPAIQKPFQIEEFGNAISKILKEVEPRAEEIKA